MNVLIFVLIALISPTDNLSETKYWDGEGGDNLWSNPSNWDNDMLPANNDDIIINDSYTVIVNMDYVVESVALSEGAHLIIPEGVTFSTTKGGFDGSDGIRLVGTPNLISTLTIEGHLSISMADAPCLLYTSPSPRDKRQSRMPSSA